MPAADLFPYLRDVPDFPQPGIMFKDITPLLADPKAFGRAVDGMCEGIKASGAKNIIAIESRGFILGSAIAQRLHLPLQLVRKPGKLPRQTRSVSYQLEYGTDSLEMHDDAVKKSEPCAIVDDVLATGGTASACARLVSELGGDIACFSFLLEISALGGRAALPAGPAHALLVS